MKMKLLCLVLVISVITCSVLAMTACNKKGSYTPLTAQANIFTELNAKTADVGIMDYTMANYLLKTESDLANKLMIADTIEFEKEYYGIAFRDAGDGKYNALCDYVNKALVALKATDYKTITDKYGATNNAVDLTYTAPTGTADNKDMDKIKTAGKIVIGFTFNAPMAIGTGSTPNAQDGGIDTELAKAVFNYIGTQAGATINIEWKLIDWGNKESEMQAGTIDCVWNGLTITEERSAMWDITMPYLENKQCAVIRKADKDKYTTSDSLKTIKIVAEDGSAGEDVAKDLLGIID